MTENSDINERWNKYVELKALEFLAGDSGKTPEEMRKEVSQKQLDQAIDYLLDDAPVGIWRR